MWKIHFYFSTHRIRDKVSTENIQAFPKKKKLHENQSLLTFVAHGFSKKDNIKNVTLIYIMLIVKNTDGSALNVFMMPMKTLRNIIAGNL